MNGGKTLFNSGGMVANHADVRDVAQVGMPPRLRACLPVKVQDGYTNVQVCHSLQQR